MRLLRRKEQITGKFTAEDAKTVKSNQLALPFSLKSENNNSISPTLGSSALDIMLKAGFIGFILVCLFIRFITGFRLWLLR